MNPLPGDRQPIVPGEQAQSRFDLGAVVDEHLFGAGFATLADHLVGKQRLDPSLATEAIMREMLRPVLHTGSPVPGD